MSKDLPSIDDFAEDNSNLPSINDYLTEENAEELPSVEDFIEKEEEILTEATQTIEDADGNSFAEVKDIVPPWPELVKMVNDVRADIPDIPEIKYYDKELEELRKKINNGKTSGKSGNYKDKSDNNKPKPACLFSKKAFGKKTLAAGELFSYSKAGWFFKV